MLLFKLLTLRNFLSFGNVTTELDLEFNGTTLILGENMDAAGANGVGKSTIINAISFALYNKPISNISKERLINRTNTGNKNTAMEVRLVFMKDDIEYDIYRARGETNATVLKRDGVDITPDSVSNIDKAIEEIVGFSFELFSRVIVFAGSAQPFLDLPVSTQRNHIEELFNITTLSQKALSLRDKIKSTESDITVQDALILQQERSKEFRIKQLTEAESRVLKWEDDTSTNIETIQKALDSLNDIDFEAEQAVHTKVADLNTKISSLEIAYKGFLSLINTTLVSGVKWQKDNDLRKVAINKKLKLIDGVDLEAERQLHLRLSELTELLQKAESEKKLQSSLDKQMTKRLAEIEHELSHLADSKCPYCSQVYQNGEKVASLEKEKEEESGLLAELKINFDKNVADAARYTQLLVDAHAAIKYPNLAELMDVHADAQSLRTELQQLSETENPHQQSLIDTIDGEYEVSVKPEIIEAMLLSDTASEAIKMINTVENSTSNINLNKHKSERDAAIASIQHDDLAKLLNVKANADQLKVKLADLREAVNPHIEAYQSLLSDGEVKIDNEKLDELKSYLEHQQFLLKLLTDKNSYIRKNIVNQTIPFLNSQINHYTKELGLPHIVRFDPDMSCTVTECGRDLDFGNLSGGEKKRVNLALSIAFRDVLHHLHSKVNLLMLDEIDGGSVDSIGVSSMTRLLKRKSRDDGVGIWTISHHPEMLGRMDRELVIRKENGFSSIILPEHS